MKQVIAGLTALVGACVIGVIVEGGVTASTRHDQDSSSGPIVVESVGVSAPLTRLKPYVCP
jgi:hypothetical protein